MSGVAPALHPPELSAEQKRQFYRDGFIVLKNAVEPELTYRAKRRINVIAGRPGRLFDYYGELSGSPEFPALVNESCLGEILRNTMGPYDPPQRAMPMVLYPSDPSPEIGHHGLPDDQLPNYGFFPHLDGLWTGAIPKSQREVDDWDAPRTEHFGAGDATVIGRNMTPLFQDPECRLSIGSFTCFVGVALNDQTEFGRGNLAVLRGAHHAVEAFFRWQREQGGPIGPEGPGWPRLVPMGEDGVGMNYLPQTVRDQYSKGAEYTPDGAMWPQPTPVLLDEGDAVLTVHAIPHCGTRNYEGAEPRMNVYFRLRRERPGGARVLGDSDHPDRGWKGNFLDYPEGYDPWQVAIDALCDHWSEWDGMADIVADERATKSWT